MKKALFLNCHEGFGGAERRFARVFNQMKNPKLFLICNRATYNILTSRGFLKSHKNIIVYPGGSNKNGFIYKLLHFYNFIMLMIVSKRNHIDGIHYPVDPSIYTFLHSIFSIKSIPFSISVVNSSYKSRQDLSSIRYYIWKVSLSNASRLDILSPSIMNNIERIYKKKLTNCYISPCSFTDYEEVDRHEVSERRGLDFVMLSRLDSKKGFDLIINALLIHESSFSEKVIDLYFYGKGPLYDEIVKRTKSLTKSNVTIRYAKSPISVFKNSKVFLSLQKYENYPSQSLLEAISSGCFIIATDVGDTRSLLNESNSLLIKDENELLDAIYKIQSDFEYYEKKAKLSSHSIRKTHSIERFSSYFKSFLWSRND